MTRVQIKNLNSHTVVKIVVVSILVTPLITAARMSRYPLSSSDSILLKVVIVGASENWSLSWMEKWTEGVPNVVSSISTREQTYEFVVGKYTMQLRSTTDTTGCQETLNLFRDCHVVVFVYDIDQPREERKVISDVWIPQVADIASENVACFLVEINRVGSRQPGYCDRLYGSVATDLFRLLPGLNKEFVKLYPSDKQSMYSQFRSMLIEAAKNSHKVQKQSCTKRDCCRLT